MRTALALAVIPSIALAGPAASRGPAALRAVTDIEVRPALEQAIEEFGREGGGPVELIWADPQSLAARAKAADIIVWQQVGRQAGDLAPRLAPGTEKVLAWKRLAILTRQGNPKGIGKLADLARAGIRVGLASEAWATLHRATGDVLARAEEGPRIRANLASRPSAPGRLVEAFREGAIDAALGWDALEGLEPFQIDVVRLPEGLAPPVSIRVAVARGSRNERDARSFVEFLASLVGQAVVGRYGYEVALHHAGADAYETFVERRLKRTYPLTARRMLFESGIRSGRCLDVGWGTGQLEVALARLSDLEITGLDIDPGMIERARKRIEAAGLAKRVRLVVGDVHELPFDDRAFDLVVSRGSLLFWQDKVKALREIARVLKPEGYALLGGRYLFTPARYKVSGAELGRIATETGIPRIRVIEERGQWVEIRGPKWTAPRFDFRARMAQLAGWVVADYGIAKGRCVVIANRPTGLAVEIAGQTELRVLGVLPSEEAVLAARKAADAAGLGDRIRFAAARPQAIPLPAASADLVVSVGALPFWPDRVAVFREIDRVLRPGGVAFLGGRYLHMPAWRRVRAEDLRRSAQAAGLRRFRVIEDRGQWVEIRKPRAAGGGGP